VVQKKTKVKRHQLKQGGKKRAKGGLTSIEQAIEDVVSREAVANEEKRKKTAEKKETDKATLRKRRSVKPSLVLIIPPKADPAKTVGPCAFGTCKKQFKTKVALARHTRRLHGGIERACSLCGKVFARPDTLARHKADIHKQLKLQ
jgi:hypothetical protein